MGDAIYQDWASNPDVEILHVLDEINQPYSCIQWGHEGLIDIPPIIIGENCKKVSEEVSKFDGIEEVLIVDNKVFSNHLAENICPLIVEIAKSYTHILAPSSTFGKNIMPRVAALLDVAQISDIISVEN